jgi:hypothetical protein
MDLNFVKIHRIGQTISVGANGFQKTPVVVEIPGQYPQFIALEACGNKSGIFKDFNVGDVVNCKISLRGREWTDSRGEIKVINNIEVWSVAPVQVRMPAPTTAAVPDTDDVPF